MVVRCHCCSTDPICGLGVIPLSSISIFGSRWTLGAKSRDDGQGRNYQSAIGWRFIDVQHAMRIPSEMLKCLRLESSIGP
jgi:hypothetical protein